MKLKQDSKVNRSHSDLEQDQMALATDMRRLRRNLRRGANPLQIARERDWILQDWRNIVAHRGLKSDNVSAALANSVP